MNRAQWSALTVGLLAAALLYGAGRASDPAPAPTPAPTPAVTVTAPAAHPASVGVPDCTLNEGGTDPATTPCAMAQTRMIEGPDGTVHTDCLVTLVTLGSSRIDCTDGTGEVAFSEES